MDRGEVGDKRGSKEMDRCPLTALGVVPGDGTKVWGKYI
jgi:hypothetical protein